MKYLVVCLVLLGVVFAPRQVAAANGSMGFAPRGGAYDKPIKVNLVIDGKGERFNAAQASVSVPKNLVIKDLVLGDCGFSFFQTPSIEDPSFKGVMLGKYKNKCTVYTLTLGATAKGKAALSLIDANVKRYGDAAEMLKNKQNGNYTFTAVTDTPSVLGAQMTPKDGLYTVNITVTSQEKKVIEGAVVRIRTVDTKDEKTVTTDVKGVAHFAKVKTGVYTVVVEKHGKKLGEQIINVSGPQYTRNFTITVDTAMNLIMSNPLVMNAGLVIIGMLFGLGTMVLFGRVRRKK